MRSCKTSKMRFFSSSTDGTDPETVLVKVRWYFCRPGARPLPFAHAMVSDNWLKPEEAANETLGEVYQTSAWSNGERPFGADGRRFCGTVAQWQNGLVYNPLTPVIPFGPSGLPECCGVVAISGNLIFNSPQFGFLDLTPGVAISPALLELGTAKLAMTSLVLRAGIDDGKLVLAQKPIEVPTLELNAHAIHFDSLVLKNPVDVAKGVIKLGDVARSGLPRGELTFGDFSPGRTCARAIEVDYDVPFVVDIPAQTSGTWFFKATRPAFTTTHVRIYDLATTPSVFGQMWNMLDCATLIANGLFFQGTAHCQAFTLELYPYTLATFSATPSTAQSFTCVIGTGPCP